METELEDMVARLEDDLEQMRALYVRAAYERDVYSFAVDEIRKEFLSTRSWAGVEDAIADMERDLQA